MKLLTSLLLCCSCFILLNCGGSGTTEINTNNTTTYATTSNLGDYATWSLTGSTLSVNWQVIDGVGSVDHIFDITANCGAPTATGLQSCWFTDVLCTAGTGSCPSPLPSGSFDIMVVPGVALYAVDDEQLHVGFARDDTACTANVSGDYSYLHLGHGKRDIFGLYRSDNDFLTITHIDYGVTNAVDISPFPNEELTPQRVAYTTGSPIESLTDGGCTNGLRQRSNGAIDLRLMATTNGLFVLDLPEGEGGILAFKAENAATLADFENKSFGGIDVDGDGAGGTLTSTDFSVDFDQVLLDEITFTAQMGGVTQDLTLMPLDGNDGASTPAYPDFTVIANNASATVSATTNPLQSDYNTPNDLPGFFKIDNTSGTGRHIVAAVILNNKVIAFGSSYKYKTALDINPSTGLPYDPDYYIVGNWLMFEK